MKDRIDRLAPVEQEMKLPVMPQVIELPSDAEIVLAERVTQIVSNSEPLFRVELSEEMRHGKQLGLVNNHLVYFRKNEPQEVRPDLLLIGAIAARDGAKISNPEKFNIPGLEAFKRTQRRILDLGIDLSVADKGDTIDLSALEAEVAEQAKQIIMEEIATAIDEGQEVIHWLGHKKIVTDGRNVRTDILGVARNEKGEPAVELNPHKRYSVLNAENIYVVTPADPTMVALLERKKVGDKSLTEDEYKAIRAYQTAESGFRNVLQVEMHRPFTPLLERSLDLNCVADVQSILQANPDVFNEPLQTIVASKTIEQVRAEVIRSGAWVVLEDDVHTAVQDSDAFQALLSSYDPIEARHVLINLARSAEYYIRAEVPTFEWGAQGPVSKKVVDRQEKPQVREGERRTKLADAVGIPDSVLPSSVLGVSMTMGLVEQGKVYTVSEKEKHPEGATVVYGTTDFANPAELIMLANAAKIDGKETRALYFADERAHSVGSYMSRILIPSLVSIYGITEEEAALMYESAQEFEEDIDVALKDIERVIDSDYLSDYFSKLSTIVGKQETFAGLYAALNNTLAARLGVDYIDADAILSQSGLTIEDLNRRISEIGVIAEQGYEAVKEKLEAVGLPKNKVDGMLETMFGKHGAWDTDTRRFLRTITGDESTVDHRALPGDTNLADLGNRGITLGGNGWVVVMQSIDFGGPRVIAHKNTALGGNYTTPVLESDDTTICLSPIVRVVPTGQGAMKGDGLDIGAYILFPSLVDQVAGTFQIDDAKFTGGQQKAVVEFGRREVWLQGQKQAVHTVTTSFEPSNGGKREVKNIALAA